VKNKLILIILLSILVIPAFSENREPGVGGEEEPSFTLGPGDYDFSLEHDGLTRTYKLHVPRQYDRREQVPIVLYIHGGGGNARSAYLDKMDKSSDKFGFILAIPEATGEVKFGELRGSWNGGIWATGKCCGSADDVGFTARMIEEIKSNFNVDEKRIYATGISNGGLMTNRIGCELSGKIAAIATVAPSAIPSGCKPLRPLPVMDIHGTADIHNPFYGGEPSSAISLKVDYKRMMPEQVVGRWLEINGCVGEPAISILNSKVTYSTYAQCKSGSEVVFVKVEDMGHAWPSGFESKLLGIAPVSNDFSFDQMWEFFKKHPLETDAQ
jgi:polyhydroxybutyrate depolymerase